MKFLLVFLLLLSFSFAKGTGFTQEDRERLIRLEATLRTFMEQVDKRLEQVDKRISEFREDTNRRFEELREDMNKRFEQVNKRFEQVGKRFEQVNQELNRMVQIMVAIFGGQFALVGAVIAFAWWDRRTIVREAKRQTIDELERETKPEKLRKLLNALREKAKTDPELREILKKEGLL